MLKIILRAGVDINVADYDDRTPLHVAGDNGLDVIYQILIDSGANPNKIDWVDLSLNINAIEILKDNVDKIDWDLLSENVNAIEILKANPNKIDWNLLSLNINAIEKISLFIFIKIRINYLVVFVVEVSLVPITSCNSIGFGFGM